MLSSCTYLIVFALAFQSQQSWANVTTQWDSFNTTIFGRLKAAAPFARSCFQLANTATGAIDDAECGIVQAGYLNHTVRVQSFGAYMNTEWEGCQSTSEQCLLDWTNPFNTAAFTSSSGCNQGSVSQFYLEVENAADAQAAFSFAHESGVPLSIKNSGHDYSGRSSMIGSLGLWTHKLNNISFNPNFIPKGCSTTKSFSAVTAGAGVLVGDIVAFADANNITLPTGADDTVGAVGGYLQGGGHSPLSNIYGLAVDRALEFEIVTPEGQHVFANDCQNKDLFFALRGGGGGTFGLVLEATMRAFPQSSFTTLGAQFNGTTATISILLDFLIKNAIQWAEDGWSGFIIPSGDIFLASAKFNLSEGAAHMAPLKTLVETQLNGTFQILTSPSYKFLHDTFITSAGVPVGIPAISPSRLVTETAFTSFPTDLHDVMLNLSNQSAAMVIFANTPFSFKPFKGSGPTSVTPAWRSALWHVTIAGEWNFNTTLAEKKGIFNGMSELMDSLRALTPGSGAYHNEADVHEPDFSASFWGRNYDRLLAIKNLYDPKHILDCWKCVGWRGELDPNFRCYI